MEIRQKVKGKRQKCLPDSMLDERENRLAQNAQIVFGGLPY
jgi:hypothetical protein